jgi:hypothetical protein
MQSAGESSTGTTPDTATPTDDPHAYSLGRVKRCCSGRCTPMPSSRGGTLLTTADKMASVVPSSATRASTKVQDSFDRRMRLLTASGLIAGTTRSWTPPLFGLGTPDGASCAPGGVGVGRQNED